MPPGICCPIRTWALLRSHIVMGWAAKGTTTAIAGFKRRYPSAATESSPSTKSRSKNLGVAKRYWRNSLPLGRRFSLLSTGGGYRASPILALGLFGRYNERMRNRQESPQMHGTTVLCVRKDNKVVLIADGQVTMGDHVMKHTARKTRRLYNDKVVAGFAGSTADAITLFERFEG